MPQTRCKLNVNERGVKHFHNEIEVWDENDNAPEDIYTVCRQLQREHNAHAALVEALEDAKLIGSSFSRNRKAIIESLDAKGYPTNWLDGWSKKFDRIDAALQLAKGG